MPHVTRSKACPRGTIAPCVFYIGRSRGEPPARSRAIPAEHPRTRLNGSALERWGGRQGRDAISSLAVEGLYRAGGGELSGLRLHLHAINAPASILTATARPDAHDHRAC